MGDKDSAAGSDSASFGGKKFIVNRFVIEGVGVNATLDMYGEAADVKLRLPRIKSNNVIYAVHTQQFNEKQ